MSIIEGVHRKIPVAMTIAGSDSGGGAGIEADLKTFVALGVHGTVALTAITAQNTYSVTMVQDVDVEVIKGQIDAVAEDMGIDAAKTGMLHTAEIIEVVAEKVKEYGFPLVVDPVMVAKSGAPLLKKEAIKTLVMELIPLATVVTPNAYEAEILARMKIKSKDDMIKSAKKIIELGPKAVVIKGGHVKEDVAIDVLYYEGRVYEFSAPRIESRNTHGTGCSFSAAITAELAKGSDIVSAVRVAKEVVRAGITFGLPIGKGYGPVNPLALLYKEANKYRVLKSVEKALRTLLSQSKIKEIIPEVGMNLVEAVPYAETVNDVVGIPGRIRASNKGPLAFPFPDFGASSHLARYVLTIMKYDPNIRAAVNIKFDKKFIEILKELGLIISYYDRREEPEDVKRMEGMTIPWGVKEAIKRINKVPNVIYHLGDWGKEPMIVLFSENAQSVVKILLNLLKKLGDMNE